MIQFIVYSRKTAPDIAEEIVFCVCHRSNPQGIEYKYVRMRTFAYTRGTVAYILPFMSATFLCVVELCANGMCLFKIWRKIRSGLTMIERPRKKREREKKRPFRINMVHLR